MSNQQDLKWTDVLEIAIELDEKHPEVNPLTVRFTDLHQWVTELEGFNDDPGRGGERILEAIQQCWIEEKE